MSTGRLKIAATLILTSPFVPMLFQGEEWGASTPFLYFTGHEDPELAHAVSEGRKREFAAFGWTPNEIPDPQAIETFECSKLNWDEPALQPHDEILEWHRQLIRLRALMPELRDGRMDLVAVSFDETARWLKLKRGRLTVALNLSDSEQSLTIESGTSCRIAMASDPRIAVRESCVHLPADSVAILAQ